MIPDTYELPEDPDDARMRRVAAGDTAAFAEIIRTHQGRIAGFAARMLGGDRDAAEDVTQETFLRLWRVRCAYRPQGNLTAYLFRVAANLCRDRQRSQRETHALDETAEIASDTPTPEVALNAANFADAIRRALTALPEPQRAVFVLSHYEGLPYREIAALLDIPIGTVASRKSLAVATLRRRLRHYGED